MAGAGRALHAAVSPRRRAAFLLVALALAAAFLADVRARVRADDFPPFVMVYELSGGAVHELDYDTRQSWTDTVVEHETDPDRVGSYENAVGRDLISYSARFDTTTVTEGRGRWVPGPGPWLRHPELTRLLPGVALDEVSGGERRIVRERLYPCDEEPDRRSVPSCSRGEPTYRVGEEYVYDAGTGIPLRETVVTEQGTATLRQVLDFRLK